MNVDTCPINQTSLCNDVNACPIDLPEFCINVDSCPINQTEFCNDVDICPIDIPEFCMNVDSCPINETELCAVVDTCNVNETQFCNQVVDCNSTSSGGGGLPITLRLTEDNLDPLSSNSLIFSTIAYFVFRGTSTGDTISEIIAVVGTTNAVATGQIEIRDLTNVLTIATSAAYGPTSGAQIIIDIGVISNLPVNAAIFSVLLRKTVGGGGMAEIDTIQFIG